MSVDLVPGQCVHSTNTMDLGRSTMRRRRRRWHWMKQCAVQYIVFASVYCSVSTLQTNFVFCFKSFCFFSTRNKNDQMSKVCWVSYDVVKLDIYVCTYICMNMHFIRSVWRTNWWTFVGTLFINKSSVIYRYETYKLFNRRFVKRIRPRMVYTTHTVWVRDRVRL